MHKFTTSTAEERKAHLEEVKDIVNSMVETQVHITSAGRGLGFSFDAELKGGNGFYSAKVGSSIGSDRNTAEISFSANDIDDAWVAASGNTIRIDTHN